jgi:hypothetical protein
MPHDTLPGALTQDKITFDFGARRGAIMSAEKN